jgi:hypothetical protein
VTFHDMPPTHSRPPSDNGSLPTLFVLGDEGRHDDREQKDGEGRGDGRVNLGQRDESADAYECPHDCGTP